MGHRGQRARAVMAAVALVVTLVVITGTVLRVGPFAAQTASAITDPEEILAGALQALLAAETVHLSIELEGTLPGGLVGVDRAVSLSGITIEADLDIAAVRTLVVVDAGPVAGPELELRTAFDRAWYRAGDGPWTAMAVSDALDVGAVDLNPLTLVERLEAYLEERPDTRLSRGLDVPCVGGMCRVVTFDAGPEPLGLAAAILPAELAAHLPDGDVTLNLQAEHATLRPVVAFVELRDPAGALIARAAIRFRDWDQPIEFEEPTPALAGAGGGRPGAG